MMKHTSWLIKVYAMVHRHDCTPTIKRPVFEIRKVYMYEKFELSVYKMLCTLTIWLSPLSISSHPKATF